MSIARARALEARACLFAVLLACTRPHSSSQFVPNRRMCSIMPLGRVEYSLAPRPRCLPPACLWVCAGV